MENFMYAEMEHSKRMEILRKTAISRETMTFQRSLTEDDLRDKQDYYTREQMRLATLLEHFKNWKARKTADIKALQKENEDLLDVIAKKSIEVFDEVYLIPDFNKSQILFIDKFGEIVHQRAMKPEERQGRLMLPNSEPSDVVLNDGEGNTDVKKDPNEHIEDAIVVEDEIKKGLIDEGYKPFETNAEEPTEKKGRKRKPKIEKVDLPGNDENGELAEQDL